MSSRALTNAGRHGAAHRSAPPSGAKRYHTAAEINLQHDLQVSTALQASFSARGPRMSRYPLQPNQNPAPDQTLWEGSWNSSPVLPWGLFGASSVMKFVDRLANRKLHTLLTNAWIRFAKPWTPRAQEGAEGSARKAGKISR